MYVCVNLVFRYRRKRFSVKFAPRTLEFRCLIEQALRTCVVIFFTENVEQV